MEERPRSEIISPDEDQGRRIELAALELTHCIKQLSIKPIEAVFDGTLWDDPPARVLQIREMNRRIR